MKKKILIGLAILAILQTFWLIFLSNYYSSGYIKTTAMVRDLGYSSEGVYPIYEYFDASGKRHVVDDKYSGAMSRTNILYPVFGSEIGDKVTLYYDKNDPTQFAALAGVWTFAVVFLPVYVVALPLLFTAFVLYALKLRAYYLSGGRLT